MGKDVDKAVDMSNLAALSDMHGRSPQRPTLEQIDRGFAAVKEDTNPFSRNIGAAAALRKRGAVEDE